MNSTVYLSKPAQDPLVRADIYSAITAVGVTSYNVGRGITTANEVTMLRFAWVRSARL